MHKAGSKIMTTHPIYIKDVGNKITISVMLLMDDEKISSKGYENFSIELSKFTELDIHVTPIDGELTGYGSYIFFKNEEDAVAFKLRWS